jgi:hypothetical protein
MTKEIPEITTVHAETGMGGGHEGMGGGNVSPSFPGESSGSENEDEGPEAPF